MNVCNSPVWIYGLGFAAQALFGLRIVLQWWLAEKNQAAVSPNYFWYTSLAGSSLFMLYGLLRLDPIIVVAQVLSHYIYVRNLQLKRVWTTVPRPFRWLILLLPLAIFVFLMRAFSLGQISASFAGSYDWMIVAGALGQFLLCLRFVVQLYISERKDASLLSKEFWLTSVAGCLLVIGYAWFRDDLVLLVVQSGSLIIYIRNIYLIRAGRGMNLHNAG